MSGRLLLVGTPIGNLSDLSPRAVEALQSADLILCEDTRHSRKLLSHFSIDRPTESFHEHNEEEKTERIIERIERGQTIALISDAGMPLVSDPGYRLVRAARVTGLTIEPIPGPFAAVLALVASGLPPLPFTFAGFTPHRAGERRDFYRRLADFRHTTAIYESPERLAASLADALEVLGDVPITVAREMTKMHEEFISGTISEVIEQIERRGGVKGEITLVIGAAVKAQREVDEGELRREFDQLRSSGMRRNDAVKVVAERYGLRKNDVYQMLIDRPAPPGQT